MIRVAFTTAMFRARDPLQDPRPGDLLEVPCVDGFAYIMVCQAGDAYDYVTWIQPLAALLIYRDMEVRLWRAIWYDRGYVSVIEARDVSEAELSEQAMVDYYRDRVAYWTRRRGR